VLLYNFLSTEVATVVLLAGIAVCLLLTVGLPRVGRR
jgi:hypothetical protein